MGLLSALLGAVQQFAHKATEGTQQALEIGGAPSYITEPFGALANAIKPSEKSDQPSMKEADGVGSAVTVAWNGLRESFTALGQLAGFAGKGKELAVETPKPAGGNAMKAKMLQNMAAPGQYDVTFNDIHVQAGIGQIQQSTAIGMSA